MQAGVFMIMEKLCTPTLYHGKDPVVNWLSPFDYEYSTVLTLRFSNNLDHLPATISPL